LSRFTPNLGALPAAQRRLWPELAAIPGHFVLYGGTAIALRLGHRQSVDFDFFSSRRFTPDELARTIPLLANAPRLQSAANTLTVSIERGGPVKLSFFGGLGIGRVGTPDQTDDNCLWVASLSDVAATKMAVIQQRAEKRDYLDVHAILQSGISLTHALGAAQAIYGEQFNPAITLKALAYFRDGDLPSLPPEVKAFLESEAVRLTDIPTLQRRSNNLACDDQF